MEAHKLVKMANQIADFFEAEADRSVALDGIAGHLRRFWDPRMRRQIVAWLDQHGGEGLKPIALEAVKKHRETLLPPASPSQPAGPVPRAS